MPLTIRLDGFWVTDNVVVFFLVGSIHYDIGMKHGTPFNVPFDTRSFQAELLFGLQLLSLDAQT